MPRIVPVLVHCVLDAEPSELFRRPRAALASHVASIIGGRETRHVTAWVLHVDLDQFIAAVEVLRRPELRGLPVVVGGDGDPAKRGVVATASYEARVFGVHSGLPMRTAARRSLGAVTEVMGWDEAFLAVDTDDPEEFARRVQRTIRAATSLECTVGIGQNKLQAK